MVLIRLVFAVPVAIGSMRPIIFVRQEDHHDAPLPDQVDAWRGGADRDGRLGGALICRIV
jgi:hypothetical protein